MDVYKLINSIGLIIELVGAYFVVSEVFSTEPNQINSILRTIMGNRINDKDLDKNKFLASLIREALGIKYGFILVIIGVVFQLVSTLISVQASLEYSNSLLIFLIVAVIAFSIVKCLINKKYASIKEKLKSE
jgi:uncharacterized membrane protein